MRIAVLILGLLLGLLMFLQTFVVYAFSSAFDAEEQAVASAVGLLVAVIWLVGCAFVVGFPLFSTFAFVGAAVLAFAVSGSFPDMGVWGVVALALALMSFFGWRGKRKARKAKLAEELRQRERDDRLEALLTERQRSGGFPLDSIEVPGRTVASPALATGGE